MNYRFDCGCCFEIAKEIPNYAQPCLKFDYKSSFNESCPIVWDMFQKGVTLGVFQLESNLAKKYCKMLKPICIEHLSALAAVIRPGCVSGDTSIDICIRGRSGRKHISEKLFLRDLYEKFQRNHFLYEKNIVSFDEDNNLLFNNTLKQVFFNGIKNVYKPKFKIIKSNHTTDSFYLECTLDHKLFVLNKGWTELQNISLGDRVALKSRRKSVKYHSKNKEGEKYFRNICFLHRNYKCLFCDWLEGSLDVNHIEGNRKTNNHPDNLCFLCPNHHRLYSEGKILKQDVLDKNLQNKLPVNNFIEWGEYAGYDYVGEKDVYDIEVTGPNHSYIAGNVIVHNCLGNQDEKGISITERYCKRKNNEEPVEYPIPVLEPILKDTYGLLIYQESSIRLGIEIAGFSQGDADYYLRKAIGVKDAKLLFSAEEKFIEGCKKLGKVTEEEAKTIFGWIKASARYAFNKCITNDTLVETTNGLITIEDLFIGDKVKAPNFENNEIEFVEVIDKIDCGKQDVFEITLESGKQIKCTMEHKFVCEDKIIRTLDEIIVGGHSILCEND